jgi:hypothetical protein
MEAATFVFLGIIDFVRIRIGQKGNKTQDTGATVIFLGA